MPFNQDQAHVGILYVMLPVAFSLAMCWVSLNLCLPKAQVLQISPCVCVFSLSVLLSLLLNSTESIMWGGRNAMRYRNLYQSFTSSNWLPTELVEN